MLFIKKVQVHGRHWLFGLVTSQCHHFFKTHLLAIYLLCEFQQGTLAKFQKVQNLHFGWSYL